jgi:hypothetical protein
MELIKKLIIGSFILCVIGYVVLCVMNLNSSNTVNIPTAIHTR